MKAKESRFSIKSWAEDDQPRAKLARKGSAALSDSELLAILIGTGSADRSAVELGKEILASVSGDLAELAKLSVSRLMEFKGIGEAKAISIAAALELGRRRQLTDIRDKPQVTDSRSAYYLVAPLLVDKVHEEFWVLYLNRSNRVIDRHCLSMGGISGTVVDPRLVFGRAVQLLASSIVLCHNHPSGQLKPSTEDIQITRKLIEGGKVLDVKVLDHLIIGQDKYFSMSDEGLM